MKFSVLIAITILGTSCFGQTLEFAGTNTFEFDNFDPLKIDRLIQVSKLNSNEMNDLVVTSAGGLSFFFDGNLADAVEVRFLGQNVFVRSMIDIDIDNDGVFEIIVTGSGTTELFRLQDNGSDFDVSTIHEDSFQTLRVADLNGDGFSDLLATTAQTVEILFNDQNGNLAAPELIENASFFIQQESVSLSDIDGDGLTDIVLTPNNGNGPIRILINDSEQTFSKNLSISAMGFFDAGDVDQDGDVDLLIESNGLAVRLNNGDGVFSQQTSIDSSIEIEAGRFKDLDSDGDLDLLAFGEANEFIIFENSNGLLVENQTGRIGSRDSAIELGDLNNDGFLDMVIAETTLGVVYTNDTNNQFAVPQQVIERSLCELFVLDLQNDSSVDLLVRSNSVLSSWQNIGDNQFSQIDEVVLSPFGRGLEVGRPFGDERVAAFYVSRMGWELVELINGEFAIPLETVPLLDEPSDFAVGDLDSDGDLDSMLSMPLFDQICVIENNGDVFASQNIFIDDGPRLLEVADLNGDLIDDLAVCLNDRLAIVFGNADGELVVNNTFPIPTLANGIEIGDLNGDSHVDVIVNNATGRISRLFGDGIGGFENQEPIFTGHKVCELTVADIDSDDDLDVVYAFEQQGMRVLLNDGEGAFPSDLIIHTSVPVRGITLCDTDNDGDQDLLAINSNRLFLYLNEGTQTGDINGDGVVDLLDIAPFIDVLVSSAFNPAADINGDGSVDLLDVSPFVNLIISS